MARTNVRLAAALCACAAAAVAGTHVAIAQRPAPKRAAAPVKPASGDWPTYGHDPGGTRFSPLAQITPANAARLEPAWVYHMKPPAAAGATVDSGDAPLPGRGRGGGGFASGETTPLVVNGVMYVSTP